MRVRLLFLLLVLVTTAVPAWAGTVTVTAEGVEPDPITVNVGEPVDFVNESDQDVRFFDDAELWDSGPLGPGETFSISFDETGRVTYTSEDGEVFGAIIVVDEDAGADGMPDTGAPVGLLASLSLGGLAAGALLLRRAR